jgi:hypothetical protein
MLGDANMRFVALAIVGVALLASACARRAHGQTAPGEPVFVSRVPEGYRDWVLVSVAREEGALDDIRAVLGNDVAIRAYRSGKLPFPEGTVIARLAYAYESSAENDAAFGQAQSFVAGAPKNGVQFMVKDSRKYAATDGWGYGHFDAGRPADEAMMQTCHACHRAVATRDFVFTRYAP